MKWEETITTTFKTKLCVVSREYFVNMRKLHLLTKIHHHTLYHVSGVVVRSRRTVLRRPRTSHAVLRRRRTQVLPWRASTYDGVRRRRTRFIIIGLCDYRFLSQDYLEQGLVLRRRTSTYVVEGLSGSLGSSLKVFEHVQKQATTT